MTQTPPVCVYGNKPTRKHHPGWRKLLASPLDRADPGQGGSKAFSKIASLLLAAIAVMFIRRGILMLVSQAGLH